jgi:DNA-binding MarR family transcriptional regulator
MQKESLGQLLDQVCRTRHGQMHAVLKRLGLYRGQPFVLRALWEEEGITHSELAQRLHVQPATISNMLRRMEKAGFVQRRPDPEDRRLSRVYLTEAGRGIHDEVRRAWGVFETRAFDTFTPEERTLLRRLLLQIRENLD